MERFDECTSLYKTIIDVDYDDFGLERETNVMAAQAAAALAGSEVSMSNAGCNLLYSTPLAIPLSTTPLQPTNSLPLVAATRGAAHAHRDV